MDNRVRSILALQRGAGNAATARVIRGVTPVQRFTKVPVARQQPGRWRGLGVDLRVSDDGQMAVEDSAVFAGGKTLFTTPAVRQSAQAALEGIGSPLTLEAGDRQLQGTVPGSGGLLRKRKGVVLEEVVPVMQRDEAAEGYGGRGEALRTVEACSAHGMDVMDATAGGANQAMIDIGDKSIHNTGDSGNFKVTSDLDAQDEVLRYLLRKRGQLTGDTTKRITAEQRSQGKALYNSLSKGDRRKLAKELLINEYASPGVGEGVEALRTGTGPTEGKAGQFPMHFAPVVARSGADYVTLENYARSQAERGEGDTGGASGAWYFRMYGPLKTSLFKDDDDQSYYGQHAEEGSIGERENLIGLTNRPQRKDA